MDKKYDEFGQRMTDCCGAFATFGGDVTIQNLDSVKLTCTSCGQPVSQGEGDQTEFLPGVTREEWLAAALHLKLNVGKSKTLTGKLHR